MKKYILLIMLAVVFTSCKDTWDDEDKKTFYQSCIDAARAEGHDEVKSKAYCDCLIDRVIDKYPNEADALEHMESFKTDTSMQQCKEMLK